MGDDSWDTNDVDDFQEIDESQHGHYDDDGRDDDPDSPQPPAKGQASRFLCEKSVEDLLVHFKELHPPWAEWLEGGSTSQ